MKDTGFFSMSFSQVSQWLQGCGAERAASAKSAEAIGYDMGMPLQTMC